MSSHDAPSASRSAKSTAGRAAQRPAAAPVQAQQVLQGPGEPLHAGLRSHFGQRFGCDFGRVRVHADAAAAASARALDAQAYTVGRHIVFGQSEYGGDGRANLPLLAHELAHVVQQGSQPYDPARPLPLQAGTSRDEGEAHAAAQAASGSAALQASRGSAGTQRLQRAEHGTYVSTLSDPDKRVYLETGEKFYKSWGYPNVRKVSTTEDILDDLGKAKDKIERFRIVSHGTAQGLELGLLKEIHNNYFWAAPADKTIKPALTFTSKAGFREHFEGMEILNESTMRAAYKAAWDDTDANALLVTLGGTKTLPAKGSDLGIVFRALVEERYLADVRTAAGTAPKFKNSGPINTFVNRRRDEYSALLIAAKSDKAGKAAVKKALAELRGKLKTLLNSTTVNFGELEDDEAERLANNFSLKGVLNPTLARAIGEGASGGFLQKLAKVRAKIDTSTHIEIRGCNVGDKKETLDAVRNFFGLAPALPSISAPNLYQYFYTLNAKSYSAAQQTELEDTFDDPLVGIGTGYTDQHRLAAKQMVRTAADGTLKAIASSYGFNADSALKLTPEIADADKVTAGTAIWLVQRTVAPLGRYKDLKEFGSGYLGNASAEAKLKAANPTLADASNLNAQALVSVPKDLRAANAVDTSASLKSAFAADVRAGKAPVGLASELDRWVRDRRGRMVKQRQTFAAPRPVVHVDDKQRSSALGNWLAAQSFDAKRGTGAELAKRFGKTDDDFDRGQQGTFVQFLSHKYPTPEDPIFPQDPRYAQHIKREP